MHILNMSDWTYYVCKSLNGNLSKSLFMPSGSRRTIFVVQFGYVSDEFRNGNNYLG